MDRFMMGLLIVLAVICFVIVIIKLLKKGKGQKSLPPINNYVKNSKLKPPIDKKDAKEKFDLNESPELEEGSVQEKIKQNNLSWWSKRKLRKHPSKSFLIKMLFSNGTSKEFVIKTNKELFKFRGRWYHLRYENCYYNLTQGQYELAFFDDFTEPLDREIKRIGNDAFYTVTPENVKPIIDMNYVKVLASSQEIDKWLKMCAILSGLVLMGIMYIAYQLSEILTQVKIG